MFLRNCTSSHELEANALFGIFTHRKNRYDINARVTSATYYSQLSKRSHLQLVSWVAKTCTNTSRLVANTSHPVNNHYNSNPDIIWTNLVCVTWINFNTFLHFLTRAKNISPFHLELSSLISFWALFSNFSCTILLPVSPFVYFFSVTTFITLNFSYTVDLQWCPIKFFFPIPLSVLCT